jgi:hypothetical protein
VEAASAMKPCATVEPASAMEAPYSRTVSKRSRSASDRAAPKTGSAEESRAADKAGVSKSVEPRAGTDEDAAIEPTRAIVANGSARVWVIWIVAVAARGRRANVGGSANADADDHPLCVRV